MFEKRRNQISLLVESDIFFSFFLMPFSWKIKIKPITWWNIRRKQTYPMCFFTLSSCIPQWSRPEFFIFNGCHLYAYIHTYMNSEPTSFQASTLLHSRRVLLLLIFQRLLLHQMFCVSLFNLINVVKLLKWCASIKYVVTDSSFHTFLIKSKQN